MSPSSIAWQTPTATASWPIATCRKPGSSPARKRSSTFSSKRRMSSISRRNSRSVSSPTARFLSTFAKAPAVYVSTVSVAEQWEDDWIQAARRLGAGRSCASSCATARRPIAAAALLAPTGPYRAAPTVLLLRGRRATARAASPESIARLLRRLDERRRSSFLDPQAAPKIAEQRTATLVEGWDALRRRAAAPTGATCTPSSI